MKNSKKLLLVNYRSNREMNNIKTVFYNFIHFHQLADDGKEKKPLMTLLSKCYRYLRNKN
jgi:hypothetical protein